MKLSELKLNPNNPRIIKDDKFKKLVKSIQEFPEMMEKRPIVCVTDEDGIKYPLGGNMRLKALQELKYKEIPDTWVVIADEWTEEQRKQFIIKDNVSFGEWEYNSLKSDWDIGDLKDWGVDIEDEVKEEMVSRGTIGNAIISDKPKALLLIEIEDEVDMANFKSKFGRDVWVKNDQDQQKMIFSYSYFVNKIEENKE